MVRQARLLDAQKVYVLRHTRGPLNALFQQVKLNRVACLSPPLFIYNIDYTTISNARYGSSGTMAFVGLQVLT